MKISKAKQNTVDLIRSSIETLKLNYRSVVNQNIKEGTFTTNNKQISDAKLYFSNLGIEFNLFKSPRREDDAIIFLLKTSDDKFCLKILPDVWIGMAEHIRHKGYLSRMSESKYLQNIHLSKLDASNESILYLYDYMEGMPLSKMVDTASARQKKEILKTFKKCIDDWVLNYNLDVNFDDLDNFLIDPSNLSDISLTDVNVAFQASGLVPKKDLLRIVRRRALRLLSEKGFDRNIVYHTLFKNKLKKSKSD
jgi:hypothetical protein